MKPYKWISDEERRAIARMLQAGHSALEVQRRTGRSAYAVRRIRDVYEIPPVGTGRAAKPDPVPADDDEESPPGPARATPWIPPYGYDPFAERHNQRQWLAMLQAATDEERGRLRAVVCKVLDLPMFASDELIVKALVADRHTADELAGLYIAACESGWAT